MILLFTRLHSGRSFRKRDVLNAACQPAESFLRFSYDFKWIPAAIQSKDLKGKHGIIVFCEERRGEKDFTFHPIRKVRIAGQQRLAQAIQLDLQLESFANYPAKGLEREHFVKSFSRYVTKTLERPHLESASKNSFYVREEGEFTESNAFGENWINLVDHLRIVEGLRDSTFIAPVSTSPTPTFPAPLLSKCVYRESRATYTVTSNSSQSITARLLSHNSVSFGLPELQIEDSVAAVSGPFIQQQGSGVDATYILTFRRTFQKEQSMLSLRMPIGAEASYSSPEHVALITLEPSWPMLILTIGALLAGTILLSLGPDSIEAFRSSNVAETSKKAALVAKAAGSVLMACGLWLAFGKLPLKG